MERELWLELYQLLKRLDPAPYWSLARFFRLSDRERLPVGRASRSTYVLGL